MPRNSSSTIGEAAVTLVNNDEIPLIALKTHRQTASAVVLRRRRHGSQNTGMAERVKPRSREAVRLVAQGFTRDESPGEDG
jgi:hypothetical protein